MSLFQLGDFTLHSGIKSGWKIECDTLTDDDWEALAFIANEQFPVISQFSQVFGIPRGGLKFAKALSKYTTNPTGDLLIADDVWTTGESMLPILNGGHKFGIVAFARNKVPWNVFPVFKIGE